MTVARWIARAARAAADLVKRLLGGKPKNEYERIVFDATYLVATTVRRGFSG